MLIDVVVLAFIWIIVARGGLLFKTTVQTTVSNACISHALAPAARAASFSRAKQKQSCQLWASAPAMPVPKPFEGVLRPLAPTPKRSPGAVSGNRSLQRPSRHKRAARRLSLTRVQLVDCALQLFKLLPSFAELAFCRQPLVVGKVFGGFRDERVEIRCGFPRGCRCTSHRLRGNCRGVHR